ncbi:MAG: hypothetical protein QIT46_gp07 [Methanophagales virus PBV305]|uniref:Uncharacterized protein n=1 Tax=Methanophagales virus PBV305 TaxID=3071310 RepID=A0AA46TDL4_9VIRU|nr:MAG: hypothetical protein QIT46_gp07 [Methanophagales virus PBV305]UYL65059.1 MAG: hypothetical protein HJKPNNFO_00007 [Methanophagales virus PBV305]
MDIDYIITESRKMGKEKAIRYLVYHSDLQRTKRERLKKKIEEINDTLDTIYKEIHYREQQDEIVSYVPSGRMGEGKKKKEKEKQDRRNNR